MRESYYIYDSSIQNMLFQDFLAIVPKITKVLLPADNAHIKMAPAERRAAMLNLDLTKIEFRHAGVMLLIYPKNADAYIGLILRNTYSGIHSSQIAFPGGKHELGEAMQQTALRETHEEVGVRYDAITVVREFTKVYIPPSKFMVFPFLGYCSQTPAFLPDPAEVAGMVEIKLSDLISDTAVATIQMETSYSKSVGVPAFKIGDHVIWGATAMILSELKDVLKTVS